ncbi:MAG: RNB domain-containing ribonuclease [Spirochaetales bacterium]|jgi:exoribonuclease-2
MISPGFLVIYKNQLARVASLSDGRLSLEFESGEAKKVREKDVSLLHGSVSSRIPPLLEGGDFETAHAMLASGVQGRDPIPTSWKELAELVFGDYNPATAAACARFASKGSLFGIREEGPYALSFEEIDRMRQKSEEKLLEGNRRSSFIAALRAAIKSKGDPAFESSPEFTRYIADLESFAQGTGERCAIAAEAGITETSESVHQALLDSGIWKKSHNPWPARAGCILWPSRLEFPDGELPAFASQRRDMRGMVSYAIDNAWSNDPDDAIAFEDGFAWVHIADPAAFIAPDSPLDLEALSRGATLYLPEKIVPMLPEGAVTRLGLGLSPESPALSFGMRLSEDGSVIETLIVPSIVHVARLSYEEADTLLAKGDTTLTRLDATATLRHRKRLSNGAVDIDFPEVSMKVDGDDVRFVSVPATRSSEIVREMMLLAGEAAARWALERKIPFTFSSQEAPQLSKDLSRSEERPLSLSTQYQRRKGMKASIVGTECLAHQGLGLSFYSQVTSPLRRYQDLLAHHQIRAWIASNSAQAPMEKAPAAIAPLSEDEVSRRCILYGQAAASTRQAERDSRLHWIAYFLLKHPGWKGKAIVLDRREKDFWIIVLELGLEASLRTRKTLLPDDSIEVMVTRASLALRDITFDLVSSPDAGAAAD